MFTGERTQSMKFESQMCLSLWHAAFMCGQRDSNIPKSPLVVRNATASMAFISFATGGLTVFVCNFGDDQEVAKLLCGLFSVYRVWKRPRDCHLIHTGPAK
uniref:Uncharacterized protein n=1 Tax=Eutreptiella gymnastica TaxID=73025 RepID=A0A7S1IS97_9EUGL